MGKECNLRLDCIPIYRPAAGRKVKIGRENLIAERKNTL